MKVKIEEKQRHSKNKGVTRRIGLRAQGTEVNLSQTMNIESLKLLVI